MKRSPKEKLRKTREGMIRRCSKPGDKKFGNYGARGIRVCSRWRGSLDSFFLDMGEKPSPRHSIDRVDNDGHYSCGKCEECIANGWPANCRWATNVEQQSNRRNNRRFTVGNETLTLTEWSRRAGVSRAGLMRRLDSGWSVEQACTRGPLPIKHRMLTFRGETLSVTDWSLRIGVAASQIHGRLDRLGWSVERALTTPTLPIGSWVRGRTIAKAESEAVGG